VWRATGYIPSATEQLTQYFPSGLPWATNPGDVSSAQPYKYNGKEFVEMHGYDTYDYGARGYYAASGRFTTVDPLAEKYYSISPYAYCAGNPVKYIDPTGMFVDDYFNENGTYLGKDEAITDNVKITSQQSWDATKTVNSDGSESIDHATGAARSIDNSSANLSTNAELSVYNHYNPTGQTLNATSPESGNGGAAFWATKDKNGVIKTGIEVNIEGNKSMKIADHANEIKNIFTHEDVHKNDFNQLGYDGFKNMSKDSKESRAIQTQRDNSTFPLMSPEIQQKVIKYGLINGIILPIKIPEVGI